MSGSVFQASTELSFSERNGQVTVTFLRSGDLSTPATVTYDVTSESATPGIDFTGGSGTVTFAAGETQASVTFTILNDALSEATETFIVGLVSVDGGSLSVPRTCRVNILDDENPVLPPIDPPLTSNYNVVAQPLTGSLLQPINFEFSPVNPNILIVAEKSGVVRKFDLQTGQDLGVFIDLSAQVCNNEDRGLMDIVFHPDFANNPYFYAFYVADPPGIAQQDFYGNRYAHVVRYTADSATGYTSIVPGSGVVIAGSAGQGTIDINGGGVLLFDNPDTASQLSSERFINAGDPTPPVVIGGIKQNYIKVDSITHAGGSLAFGPDGMLYISTGDGASPNYADPHTPDVQNLNSLSGKILRVDPITGRGLTDNPFFTAGTSPDANISKVYQYGLRNPFSIAFDDLGRLFITDTGWNAYEEINSGAAGANFGWPWYEGREGGVLAQTSGYRDFAAAQTFYQGVANGTILVTPAYAAFGHDTAAPGFQNQVITGGAVIYDGDRYPAELRNDYFFTNFAFGQVFSVDADNRQQVSYLYTSSSEFAPVHFVQGPDGYVYYADLGSRGGGFADGAIGRLLISPASGQLVTVSAPTSRTEGLHTSATVTFTLAAVQSAPVTVTYSTLNGTAVAGTDFSGATNATVVIPAGQTSVSVTIPIVNDTASEGTEGFAVTLNGATMGGAAVAASGSRLITILDNDAPPPNLLVNGSLESPTLAAGTFGSFASVPGWTAISGGTIELWNALEGVIAPNGVNLAELDFAGARDGFYQDVTTTAGQTYILTFDLRGRPGVAASSTGVEVVWNGTVVATTTPASSGSWGSFSVNVAGTGGADRLTIREVASQGGDGLGALLDNFRLVAASSAAPSVSVAASPASVSEGPAASANIVFTLSAAQTTDVIVTWSTANGTATAGSDFTGATNATAIIAAGQTSVAVSISIVNDATFEPTETFSVALNGATLNGAAIPASGSTTVTVIDDDPAPASVTISAAPASVTEGTSPSANIVFTLNAVQAAPVVVTYSTANGTALAGSDFTGATGATATIAAGQTTVSVAVPILNDATNEPNENFSVSLVGATLNGAPLSASGAATVTIVDNDPASVNLLVNGSLESPTIPVDSFSPRTSISGWTAITGGTIELWNAHNGVVASNGVNFAELDFGSARDGFFQDVTTTAGQVYALTFDLRGRPGVALSTMGVEIVWNGTVVATAAPTSTSAWGSFSVNVSGTGGADRLTIREVAAQGGDGLGALIDNFRLIAAGTPAPVVTVSASPATVAEGTSASANIVFTLNVAQTAPVVVTYSTANATATAGSDFTGATNATATIAAGQTSVTVQVPILNDILPEPNETFAVTLNGATLNGAAIAATGSATFTITDADPPLPSVSISSTPGAVTEGVGAEATVTFTLSAAQATPVVVTYSTANGTATAGADFTGVTNATATIAAGQTSVTVKVPLIDDNAFEPQESFSVVLNGATLGGVGLPASGSTSIAIANDDPPPPSVSIAAQPATAMEGAGAQATVVFTLNAPRTSPVTVTYSTANGSASAGGDFVGVSSATVDIPTGQTSVSVNIALVNDNTYEPNEAFSVTLDGATLEGAPIGASGSATIAIADDDPAPASVSVAATPLTVTEGTNPSATIVFTLNVAQASPTVVTYSTVNGTATAGADFTGITNATATIAAGQTSVSVAVPIINDATVEPNETFSVVLNGATLNGAAIAASGATTVTIVDNDAPPTNFLTNGSLEQPSVAVGGFASLASIPGWTAISGGAIELWNAHNGVVAPAGVNFAELDFAGARDGFFQDVTTTAGQVYTLTLDLRGRTGVPASSMGVEVVWNGAVVATTSPASSTAWGSFSVNVTGTGAADRLTIREVSSQGADGLGALLDNFRLISAGPPAPAVTVSASPTSVTEGGATNVTFTLNAAQASPVVVTYSTSNGTAIAGADFPGATNATVTIPAGQTSVTVAVPTIDDAAFEANETFSVLLNGATLNGAAIAATGSALLTVVDNDPAPPSVSIAASPGSVMEAAGATANIIFTLNAAQAAPVIVTYSTANGAALAGSDFTGATNATVTIAAGQTSVAVAVPILDNTLQEPSETFSVALNGATLNGAAITATGATTVTIVDNDGPPPNLLVNGSLELPTIPVNTFSERTSITGWTAVSGGRIELWNAHNGVTASAGVNFAELDFAGALDGFYQDVQTASGQVYTLTFDLRGRPGVTATTMGVEVVWNGTVVATTTPASSSAWNSFSINVTGTGDANRLTIREVNGQHTNGLGALVDNFLLVAVEAQALQARIQEPQAETTLSMFETDSDAAFGAFEGAAARDAMIDAPAEQHWYSPDYDLAITGTPFPTFHDYILIG